MPSTIICPNCRRPQEESGRLTCPDCSAILPSNPAPVDVAASASPRAAASSALDDFAIPQRPTGAMTLLRNDLRSDDKGRQQAGWLDNIMPSKKAKDPVEAEARPKPVREPVATPQAVAEVAPEPAKAKPKSAVIPAPAPAPLMKTPAASPAKAERPTPASSTLHQAAPQDDDLPKVSPLGIGYAVVFTVLAVLAMLQGKEGWLGPIVLLTVGTLAASILGIWHREGARKSFWQGFAVFGLAYLVLAFVPTFTSDLGVELPTSKLIKVVHARLSGTPEDPRGSLAIMKTVTPPATPDLAPPTADEPPAKPVAPPSTSFFAPGDVRQFNVVGHCGFTLIFAMIGSVMALGFSRSKTAF